MKAMKAMKKVSARLAERHVFAGKTSKTASGLSKGDLVENKSGKNVSKKRSAAAARKALNIKGFAVIKKGSPLYNKAKALYKK